MPIPTSYDNRSTCADIRGELQRRLIEAGHDAVEAARPPTGMPYLKVGDVWIEHEAFSSSGTWTHDNRLVLPVTITACGETFKHGDPYDINDFDWDAIVALVSGYVAGRQQSLKKEIGRCPL